MKRGIVPRLKRALMGLALIPLLIGFGIQLSVSFSSQKVQIYDQYQRRVNSLARDVQGFFREVESDLSVPQRFWSFNLLTHAEQERVLLDIASHNDAFNQIAYLGPDGVQRTLISMRNFGGASQPDWHLMASVLNAMKSGKASYGKIKTDPATGEPSLDLAMPLLDARTGALSGVLVSNLSLRKAWAKLGSLNQGTPDESFIVDSEQRVIAHLNPSVVLAAVTFQPPDKVGIYMDRAGFPALAASSAIALTGNQLAAVVTIPVHVVFRALLLESGAGLFSILFSLLGALWLFRRISNWLLKPVEALTQAARRIAAGEVDTPVTSRLEGEMATLADAFNVMVRRLQASELRFRNLSEMSSDFYWESDSEHRLTQRTESKREAAESAFKRASTIGKRRWETPYLSPDESGWQKHRAMLDAHLLFRGFEMARPRADGDVQYISISGDPVFDADGNFKGYRGVGTDITERKQAEEQLRIAAIAFESQQGMVITDSHSVILRVNRAFTETTGYTAEEVLGQTPQLLSSGRHDKDFFAAMWQSIKDTGGWQGEIWDRRKNGEIYPKWLTITAVKGNDGIVTHYVGSHTDITARKAADDQIVFLAYHDALTGLPNRMLLLDRLQQALTSSTRSGRMGALFLLDLDNFKTLNDTLGHDKGDLLLQQVGQRLATCVREGDTVGRLGGDEFVVLLEGLSEHLGEAARQAEEIGEKIVATLSQPYLLAGHENHSTPSIGVTLFGGHQCSTEELLKQADLAMYQSKAAGRNTLRFFDPQMQTIVTKRAALEVDLREAIRQKQFVLYYQPQVVGDGQLTGAEALVRWQHPQRGMVSPGDFIPLAEETGLILPLGLWVLETACVQLANWANQSKTAQLTIAVNVSAKQLQRVDFVDQVLAVLERTGASPHKLKLELTESLLVSNVEATIGKMSALNAHGVGFSLDDFGTGYSSLAYLKRLPLDQLKIDQSFVRDILNDPNDAAIAKMVIALAESMGLPVIAEGVETEAQRDFLARQGCHAYQGYLFSRPLPLAEFETFVKMV